ncbi:ABC transporter ATP-binding protein [Neobacillus mesonae]|uniref:ABC transporter ATP-binding protein n=1 Tax=Neobacillus mesonae TaxID=1193713 RepID=UPI00203C9A34|nr:ABC transporter ATP-binding protein [Neobacillus mesonae]MCM3568242.1 ABC transporter ATP-binding protein [Neobacillus mesonae]
MALFVEELTKDFGGLRALSGISFSVEPGKIVGLIGTNGAGKTTCFNVVTGFSKPTSGRVMVDGTDITGKPSHQLARKGVIRTFQQTSLFGKLTVYDNVRAGLHRHRGSSALDVLFNTRKYREDEKKINQQVDNVLVQLGLMGRSGIQADELSYGEQKRLAIAVALISKPKYLLLDEPAAGLNPQETSELSSSLASLRSDQFGILLVEHDMKMVMEICDYIVVLASGKLLAKGTPEEIRTNTAVIEAYLGGGKKESVNSR